METIDLCDSDDDAYPLHQLRCGRDENDAISLSSTDDDSIVVVGIRRAPDDEIIIAGSIAGVAQAGATSNQAALLASIFCNLGTIAAQNREAQHENLVAGNDKTTHHEASVAQASAAIQHEAAVAQARSTLNNECYESAGGGTGDSATANQEVTRARTSSQGAGSDHLPLHMSTSVTRNGASNPPTKLEDLPIRAPERSHAILSIQNNQNQIKREIKTDEYRARQPMVHARCASRFPSTSSSEAKNMPDVGTRMELGRLSPRAITCNPHRRRMQKQTARKAVARPPQADGLESDNESGGDYEQCLLAKRMNRLHGANHDDDNYSSDDNSEDSNYNTIPEDAFSPANPTDEPSAIPNAVRQIGGNFPTGANASEPDIDEGDLAGQVENKSILRGLQIPKQNNNGGLHEEIMSQDVSDISSVEDRSEGDNQAIHGDENDAGSTGSIEGPVEAVHKPTMARRRVLIQEDDESTDAGQVTPSSDDKSTDGSDDYSLDDLRNDRDYLGGVDNYPNLRSKESLDSIASDLFPMEKIQHLCSLGLNRETSLPTYKFSVHSKDDRIIYDFDVRVDKSNIPNAGRGVFLKFIGARELKPSRIAWGKKLNRSTRRLPEPLQALRPDGSRITVKLKGETFPIQIGSKRIYTETDFVPAPRRTFSSLHPNCGAIELGQYGPFRSADRVTEEKYDIHSFLFSKIPSEWGFDVPEKLNGKPQVIDITDDLTGDTHEIACRHIPMYVNEVGHNEKLKQTVSALDKDGSNVFYYVVIREPMKQGDTIELLVAYEDLYEEVRARKGYAKANIQKKAMGDDHFGSFLHRNFFDREYILEVVDELKPKDVGKMIDWFRGTHICLSMIVNNFLNQANATAREEDNRKTFVNIPLAQQIIALRRFEWIAKHFLRSLRKKQGSQDDCDSIRKSLLKLNWSEWKGLIVALSRLQDVEDANGRNLHSALEREIVDELSYDRTERIITSPMQETHWCDLAMSLTKDLCVATAKEIWQKDCDKTSLVQVYAQLAKDAVRKILAGQCTESLTFVPSFKGDCTGVAEDEIRKLNAVRSLVISNGQNTGEVLSVLTQSDTISPLEDVNKELAAIPRAVALNSNVEVNSAWYICWQVLNLVDSFARKYLKRSTYSLAGLSGQIGISVETKVVMEAALAKYVQKRAAKKRKASFSTPGKPKKKRRKNPAGGASVARKAFFWNVIWKCLKDNCGWRLERGNRPGDFYAFPPGVTRKNGNKNRVHFFDSVKQIRDKIQEDGEWKENALLKKALVQEESCMALYTKLKGTKSLPSFKSKDTMIDWIRAEVKKQK